MLEILKLFAPISLKEMDNVKLMNRKDTKFVFHKNELNDILKEVISDYSILEISGQRMMHYESVYFDTPDFHFYKDHHNGKLNRLKVRMRRYIDSDNCFLEIKFKNNKFKTIKKRRQIRSLISPLETESENYLQKTSGYSLNDLETKILITYIRSTFVSKNYPERVTIDTNLAFIRDGEIKQFPNLAIAEIKQEKAVHSVFGTVMGMAHIHPGSISKYCLGIASMYDGIKKNNFKEKINTITKISNVEVPCP